MVEVADGRRRMVHRVLLNCLSALGGVIGRRNSINIVHYMRQNGRSCKTVGDGKCIPKLFPTGAILRLPPAP